MRIFNTLTRELEEFQPLEPGQVRMYNCGPTVYNYQHIGNYRTYVFADVLRRYLEYKGFKVTQIINITDVGHLTQDHIDSGEDKLQVKARELGWDPKKVADHFMMAYFEDRRLLRMVEPAKWTRATEHIPEMIALIQKLLDKGYAYVVGGNVYFEVAKFAGYGKLSGNTLEQIKSGARIEINAEKRHPADFALWKTDPKHLMQWDAPWGRGFPGWHIECSAMSMKYLGERFDIHTGGEDNIFPHHECEIAQSEAVTGKPFVKYWLHARHVLLDEKKMAKREGVFVRPGELVQKGYDPMEIRLALASTRYREQTNFSMKLFDDAKLSLGRLVEAQRKLEDLAASRQPARVDPGPMIRRARMAFEGAMDDDLNVSGALAVVHEYVRDINRAIDLGELGAPDAAETLDELHRFDSVLGVLPIQAKEAPPPEVLDLARQREEARKRRDFKAADALRDKIKEAGWAVEDSKAGQKWKRIR